MPDDTADPNEPDVGFDWPESGPSAGSCKPGRYEGTFECTFNGFAVTGNVALELSAAQTGEFLEVHDGVLDGLANGFTPFTAEVHGELDCEAATFEARIENGSYGTPPFGGTFLGSMRSSYDKVQWAFPDGTWETTETSFVGGMCNGTWNATLVP